MSVLIKGKIYSFTQKIDFSTFPFDKHFVTEDGARLVFYRANASERLMCSIQCRNNHTTKISAVKLEHGPRFTGWPVWNYALELAKCQRYQIEIFDKKNTGQSYLAQVKAISSNLAYGTIPIPVSMRDGVLPVIKTDCSADNPYLAFGVCSSGYNSRLEITEISMYSKMNNGVILRARGSDFIPGNDYQIYVNNTNAHYFLLDCNL